MSDRTKRRKQYDYEPDYATEPGEILKETIESLGMTQKELASRTGYTTKHINWLTSGKARITPEAALRLEQVTRVPAHFWNNLETTYQEHKARIANCVDVEEEIDWLREIPTHELIKRGAISKHRSKPELLREVLSFFGVASVEAWRAGWGHHQIAFRSAAGAEHSNPRIAAWVRLAEIEAEHIRCATFDKKNFEKNLNAIRTLTVQSPDQFVPKMQELCATAGVAFALVPEIPGSRVNGVARWLHKTKAMIAINLRGKANDRFWFTFFHEAGHILNDDRDEIFVDVGFSEDPREKSANRFAAESLIPSTYSDQLKRLKDSRSIIEFADRLGIHPGIVVGRLQHEKIISFTQLNNLKCRFEWVGH